MLSRNNVYFGRNAFQYAIAVIISFTTRILNLPFFIVCCEYICLLDRLFRLFRNNMNIYGNTMLQYDSNFLII